MHQTHVIPNNGADGRFGCAKLYLLAEGDVLDGAALLGSVLHRNLAQLDVHAEHIPNDLLPAVAGDPNLYRNGASRLQTAGADSTAVGIGDAWAKCQRGVLCGAGQLGAAGEHHLLGNALQQCASGTAVQDADIDPQLIGDAVRCSGIADDDGVHLTADDAENIRIVVRQDVVQFNALLLYIVQNGFGDRDHLPIDFQFHVELLLFAVRRRSFALSYADKRGVRPACTEQVAILPCLCYNKAERKEIGGNIYGSCH